MLKGQAPLKPLGQRAATHLFSKEQNGDFKIMARPKKDEMERLGKPISFRPTKKDELIIQDKIQQSGLSSSEFFRVCVMNNKTTVLARPKKTQDKAKLLYLFNKTSNNINQIAYKANLAYVEKNINPDLYKNILLELHSLTRYMKAMMNDVE